MSEVTIGKPGWSSQTGRPSTNVTAQDREQEIYLQERHLDAIRRVQGELRFYLRANALNKR